MPPSGAGIAGHGIEMVGPMVARAVMVDVAGWYGVACLEAGTAITAAMLQGAAASQGVGVGVEAGDVVLIRTG
jgi:hypothetical protein